VIAAIWENDLRHYLIVLNVIVFIGLAIYLVRALLSPKKARSEEKLPANVEEFFPDEDLEGRRLERVQGWALIFAAIVAISLPVYWLLEPGRQDKSVEYFDENAAARGATLFANSASEAYDSATSLQCANCHGLEGGGGVAKQAVDGVSVEWKAPALNTVLLRFTEEEGCSEEATAPTSICEVSDIITFGRPGTPMQAWGVAGGGPKNFQAIADIVEFLRSTQLTPEEAQKQQAEALAAARSDDPGTTCPAYMSCPAVEVAAARAGLDEAQKAYDEAAQKSRDEFREASMTNEALVERCTDISEQADEDASQIDREQGVACGTFLNANDALADAQAALAWSLDWQGRRANVSDGQLLFELNCARCHTQGWSVFNPREPPTAVNGVDVLGLSGGGGGNGGGIGYNLRDGATERRFGTDEEGGWDRHMSFVMSGSNPRQQYGYLGEGTGKMPGFGTQLTRDMVAAIVSYERYCLEATNYKGVTPPCATPTQPRTPPTSTTTVAPAGGG
jgi:mono/diheme cytochrome c family protein